MKSKRRDARELAMKILYQVEVGQGPLDEVLATAREAVLLPEAEWDYVEAVVQGALRDRPILDEIIAERAEGWKLERIAPIDRIVLQVALYEIRSMPEIPPGVSANEAVEIAKKYSTAESGKFVNGILGSYLRERQAEAAPQLTVEPQRHEDTKTQSD